MTDLILVTGPSGVGKSTVARLLHERLDGDDWLLWQADLCQPRVRSNRMSCAVRSREDEPRMFSANLGAIKAYLSHGWSVIAEIAVLADDEATAVQQITQGRSLLVQLHCGPETLARHLNERTTPVPNEWALRFFESWQDVDLVDAIKINVDNRTPAEVVELIIDEWHQVQRS